MKIQRQEFDTRGDYLRLELHSPKEYQAADRRVVDRLLDAARPIALHHSQNGNIVLTVPSIEYRGLINSMFHMIRQNASANADVLAAVVGVERDDERMTLLQHHADLVFVDAERAISTPADIEDIRARYGAFVTMRVVGPLGQFPGSHFTIPLANS